MWLLLNRDEPKKCWVSSYRITPFAFLALSFLKALTTISLYALQAVGLSPRWKWGGDVVVLTRRELKERVLHCVVGRSKWSAKKLNESSESESEVVGPAAADRWSNDSIAVTDSNREVTLGVKRRKDAWPTLARFLAERWIDRSTFSAAGRARSQRQLVTSSRRQRVFREGNRM